MPTAAASLPSLEQQQRGSRKRKRSGEVEEGVVNKDGTGGEEDEDEEGGKSR